MSVINLEENNLKDSEKYRLAHEAVKQGKYYYEKKFYTGI